jgi:Ca-activated chloride channel homolog
VTTKDILGAVESGRLKFLMTSATQSNSGAAAYLAMLASGIGKPDLIEAGDLDKTSVHTTVRALLAGVERSSGSSGWLAELYEEGEKSGARYDGMWNYEAVIKETNDKLRAAGKELLYAVYPADGVSVADSPLGFIDRGRGKEVESFFTELQNFLLKAETQSRIAQTGRRVELARAANLGNDAATNLDPSRPVVVVRPPEPAVIQKAQHLSGGAEEALSDRVLPRSVRKHARRRRASTPRRDAFPADPGAHPRDAGSMVEGGPHFRFAV